MADRTKISWTDATWNPVRGCSPASAGCAHCWAVRDAWRLAHQPHPRVRASYEGLVELTAAGRLGWTGQVRFVPELLDQPLRWRRPRRIAVCLMGDLFHPDVGFDIIHRVFQVMKRASWHTFQLLTKRPDRLLDFCRAFYVGSRVKWPRNVLAGVSAENQATVQARVDALTQIPAGMRFLSLEPLLAPVDCSPWLQPGAAVRSLLDWVIVGGESGPGARPMHPDWARSLREQCRAASVPFFFKQWGEWAPHGSVALWRNSGREITQEGVCLLADGRVLLRDLSVAEHRKRGLGRDRGYSTRAIETDVYPEWCAAEAQYDASGEWTWPYGSLQWMYRVGKHTAGDLLDGRAHHEYPEALVSRRLRDRKGSDPAEWPSELRLQQWPSTEVVDG